MGYKCDSCNEEFGDYISYKRHETNGCQGEEDLLDKKLEYSMNVYNAVIKLIDAHKKDIKYIDHRTFDQIEGYFPSKRYGIYKFEIVAELFNGNKIILNDGDDTNLPLGKYVEAEPIYQVLKKRFDEAKISKYEGLLSISYVTGYRTEFLGAVELADIVDRLNGRMVRIEII